MRRIGLRMRLTLIYSLVLAGILISVTGISYQFLKYRLYDNLRQELRERAAGLRGYIHFEKLPQFKFDPNDPEEAFFVESSTRYYQIFDRSTGELVDQSHELDLLELELDPEEQTKISDQDFSEAVAGDVHLLFYNEILRPPGAKQFLLQIGIRLDSADDALRQLLLMTAILIPAGLALAAGVSWWMAGRALQPIRELSHAAEEIGISNLSKRLPLTGTADEIDRLSIDFNNMFERLGKAISNMQQFTASISHELRTPLTVLRGEAEVMLLKPHSIDEYRRVLSSHLEEYDKLARMINKLLTLARAESGDIRMNFDTLDIAELSRFLVEQLETVAASKQISISAKSNGPVFVLADYEWMESALLNILDNAIKYTPAGGRIDVRVENRGPEQMLEIRDTGIGISPEDLPHIFERFYRADPSRNKKYEGAGLGLNLVQWIVNQHNGRIEVHSRPGSGSRFVVWLPLAISQSHKTGRGALG